MPGGRPHRRDLQPPHAPGGRLRARARSATREGRRDGSEPLRRATGRRPPSPFQAWLELGWVSVVVPKGERSGSLDAHRDGKRCIVRVDEKLSRLREKPKPVPEITEINVTYTFERFSLSIISVTAFGTLLRSFPRHDSGVEPRCIRRGTPLRISWPRCTRVRWRRAETAFFTASTAAA